MGPSGTASAEDGIPTPVGWPPHDTLTTLPADTAGDGYAHGAVAFDSFGLPGTSASTPVPCPHP